MKLRDLMSGIPIVNRVGNQDVDISSLANDSRNVKEGALFICVRGLAFDGHRFLSQAVARGAKAGLVEKGADNSAPPGFPLLEVENTRKVQGNIAARFYGYPARKMKIISVTGTNGKTTVTYLIRSILQAADLKTALLGTIHYYIDEEELPAPYTTPDALELQQLLARMNRAGVSHLVMEASSHALALHRLSGCEPCMGIFTNLSRDHLDFHGDMEHYFQAKKTLFLELDKSGLAILNRDDNFYELLKSGIAAEILSYGFSSEADITCRSLDLFPHGIKMVLSTPAGEMQIRSPLLGRFNACNIMAAVSGALGLGIDPLTISEGIKKVSAVPGRMEKVEGGDGFTVVVDYAHTDDALRNVLTTCREFCSGRLIVTFGCGGDRDSGKRPQMGEVAGRLADYTILTSDNPRTEDPLSILHQIEKGIKGAGSDYEVIPDRKEAIGKAIRIAGEGDVVVLAGKGHENYQLLGGTRIPFDDRLVAAEMIRCGSPTDNQQLTTCN